jgi:hypothetical protein
MSLDASRNQHHASARSVALIRASRRPVASCLPTGQQEQRNTGRLHADNGPPPKWLHRRVSNGEGMTRRIAEDTELPKEG